MLDKAINTVIMPFGIKLKRTGRYILSHKNSFLIQVQLLDHSVMECTLTVENTGSDCLNAVAQKLDLKETRYFGLKYFNKQMKVRWVELEKPLKKQVDKNAYQPSLHFGIMFYVANIDRLQQEITRYLYFLQMKSNVIDGSLKCNVAQAVELASYMLQAEFGDYDPGLHTVEYFRDYVLFSQTLMPDDTTSDTLTSQTIEHHKKHRGLSASDAEYNYILKAIHLDGFSEDLCTAKNEANREVYVGCSFAGVVIKPVVKSNTNSHADRPVWHDWPVVEQISHSKATLTIEIRHADSSLSILHFHLDDADTAKYYCRMLESKRKFYQQNKDSLKRKMSLERTTFIQRRPTLRRHQENDNELNEQVVPVQPGASGDFVSSQENLYPEFYTSETSLDQPFVSQTSLNQYQQHDISHSNGYAMGGSMYSSPSINSLSQSNMGRPSPATSNLSVNSSDRRLGPALGRVGLPMYRRSPDYDVATRQQRRYSSYLENNPSASHPNQTSPHQHPGMQQGAGKPRPHSMIYSQQELIHQVVNGHYPPYPQQPQHAPLHYSRSQPPQDPFMVAVGSQQGHMVVDRSIESLVHPGGGAVLPNSGPVPTGAAPNGRGRAPGSVLTDSTPELANPALQGKSYFVSELQLYRHFPAHPASAYQQQQASTSTPDLAQHRYNGVSASTPELHVVPELQRGRLHPHPHHQPLAPVESFTEDGYIHGAVPQPVPPVHSQPIHVSTSFDHSEHRIAGQHQTPEQNVQAYLQQVTQGVRHVSPQEGATYSHLPHAGSKEHIMMDNSDQSRQNPINMTPSGHHVGSSSINSGSHQNFDQMRIHHAQAPSNATMLVYDSDSDDVTQDYLLSQQLQDQARGQITTQRVTRSSEFLSLEHLNINHQESPEHLVQSLQHLGIREAPQVAPGQPSVPNKPPPPYPDDPPTPLGDPDAFPNRIPAENMSQTSRQYSDLPVVDQDFEEDFEEDEYNSDKDNGSFRNARRSTLRKMPPMKLAAINGLSVSRRSSSPVKGEPDERVLNLEAKVEDGHVMTEFDKIPRMRSGESPTEALASRDRVKEVVPYRDNRVEIGASRDNPLGYINASHIKVSVAGVQWHYLAAQTTCSGHESEFWDMVWREQASIVVLVSKEVEHGKHRCAKYWPGSDADEDIPSAEFGPFRVMCRFDNCAPSQHLDSCVTRNLVLERAGSGEKRTIWMLQYVGWPETGVPQDTGDFLVFMEQLDSVRRLSQEAGDSPDGSSPPPVVVQCSSGAGRTGVLILTELMIQCLERNQYTAINEMLAELRMQRMHMVQTFSQYNFVYKLLIAFLRKSRLI